MKEIRSSAPDSVTGRVLVVDDHEPNRLLLSEILKLRGHTVLFASNGLEAFISIAQDRPDLVLLDVSMPDVDGFEVCRRLRADPVTAALPVILVTSLTHREHRLEGIAAGANDYLTKPIDRTDLLLRVRNALSLRKLHDELATQYEELRRLEQLRDGLVHMIVHDLRSPLMGIMSYLQLIKADVEISDPASDLPALLDEAEAVAMSMTGMVNDVLDVNRLESAGFPIVLASCDLRDAVAEAIAACGGSLVRKRIRLDLPAEAPVVADIGLLKRAIGNLIANALKFSAVDQPVVIRLEVNATKALVEVIDAGPGIPPEFQETIFDKFGQVPGANRRLQPSTGLGLAFCKLAIEAHGGSVGVKSELGRGSTFWLELPREATRSRPVASR